MRKCFAIILNKKMNKHFSLTAATSIALLLSEFPLDIFHHFGRECLVHDAFPGQIFQMKSQLFLFSARRSSNFIRSSFFSSLFIQFSKQKTTATNFVCFFFFVFGSFVLPIQFITCTTYTPAYILIYV